MKANKTAQIEKLKAELLALEPNEKQKEFFLAKERFVLYGGARGGGKSWAIRMKSVLLCLAYPNLSGVIVRQTYKELRDVYMRPLMELLVGICKIVMSEHEFQFPNGSVLKLGYYDNDGSGTQYQGGNYDFICVDEATNLKEEWIHVLRSAMRTNVSKGFRERMYFTANPGGISHAYFKRLFIDRQFEGNEKPENYRYISATVYDNKHISAEYKEDLELLPEYKRQAWLYGSWDVLEGQVFSMFRNNSEGYTTRRHSHVINGFQIGSNWKIIMSYDDGSTKPYAVGWYAIDEAGVMYNIAELYGWTGKADVGSNETVDEIAARIKAKERDCEYLAGRKITRRIADPAIFSKNHADSTAEMFARQGLYFERAHNERKHGLAQVQNRLRFDKDGKARLYFFKECKQMIRTLPLLIYEAKGGEDVDTRGEDHLYDELRYACVSFTGKSAASAESVIMGSGLWG